MKISRFAEYLARLEATTKRLEITSILSELISELNQNEIDLGIYLALGYLKAPFESQRFSIAEKMMIRILANAYAGNSEEDVTKLYKRDGDLGLVAAQIHKTTPKTTLELAEVYKYLYEIATAQGTGSQELKVQKATELLKNLDRESAKYIVRMVLGTTRLGFTELTVIDALSSFLGAGKTLREKIEAIYAVHPDIGLIAKKLKESGIEGISEITIETGVPILAQKAQRYGSIEETFEKIQDCWAEFKFDGTRVQLHMDKSKKVESSELELFESQPKFLIKTFTRNLEETTHQFPDIAEAAAKDLKAKSVILDGEAMGYDKKTGEFLPFQEIMQRKRKHSIKEMADEIPVMYFVFDILYLDGKTLLNKTLEERHEILEKVIGDSTVIKAATFLRTTNQDELFDYYEKAKEQNLEGLIVKTPAGAYQAGARSYSWVKLKKADEKLLSDSIDAVVLGYYAGRGARSKFGIGGFLIGVYDEQTDSFKTVSKVGTGLKDEDWEFLKKESEKFIIKKVPANVDLPKQY
ncbi:ATP-dependent DNA ligase, partial [Patescibacteria group bacterium]|nr:ATP-dependent DNA ligase [Patescibacteria group bacterium]